MLFLKNCFNFLLYESSIGLDKNLFSDISLDLLKILENISEVYLILFSNSCPDNHSFPVGQPAIFGGLKISCPVSFIRLNKL